MELKGKNVFITGSTRGIGLAMAHKFASLGSNIVLNGRREIDEVLVSEFSDYGVQVASISGDVSDSTDAKRMVEEAIEKLGSVDILVNNAGITKDNLLLRMSEQEFDDVIDVNLKGTWNCMKHATKLMMKQKYGRIINISSVGGIQAGPAQVSYFAAKGGVVNLTKAMAGDLAPYGILVNAIAPGVYDTEMTHDALDAPGSLVLKNRVALKRFGREGEMNGALIYFASDACTYTTGQLLVIDGGMTSML